MKSRIAAAMLSLALAATAPLPALAAGAAPGAADMSQVPLIPRKDIFGNPERAAARISPDGKMLAYLAPRDGVMNVFVAPVDAPEEAKPLTTETVRPIRQYFWAPDGSQILYIQDKGGDENFLLYGAKLDGGATITHTPFEKTRVQVVGISPDVPDAILVGLNNRDPRFHDVHRLDLKTGALTLVRQNDEGYAGFVADRQLTLRLGSRPVAGGGFIYDRLDADGKAEPFLEVGPEDALATEPFGFDQAGKTLFMIDSRGRDKGALMAIDMASGAATVMAEGKKADISNLLINPRTGAVEAYAVDYLQEEWAPIGDALKADIAFLDKQTGGEWAVGSRSLDDRFWTVGVDRVVEPFAHYLYDRQARTLTRLFSTRPALEGKPLAPMYPVEISSRDGLTLVSYLSLPPGTDPDGDGVPSKPLPLVLNVHGGPWARDDYGYHSEHQWLANRGYAVLSVNYRGSTGFGKNFLNAMIREFAGKMHDDLIDAVSWAVDKGIAQKDKVAIYGGSYGGYATLVGMTFTPTTFACGVDIVGPSNLVTLIESFPEYWKPFLETTWFKRVGDPADPKDRADLLARSPLTHVDRIQRPLLIAQGENDPRVTKLESDQLAAAMKQRNIPVTYVNYPDEGHGFARPENRTSFYAVAEGFLSNCLGGRYEPVGNDFKGATLQVLEGVEHVPGLKEALANMN